MISWFTICILLITLITPCQAQELEEPNIEAARLDIFSLNQAGVSFAFGLLAELGFSTGTMSSPYNAENGTNPFPYGGALTLNYFSPNSILNFSLRTIYVTGDQNFQLEDQEAVLSYNRLEVPLLARFNFKKNVSSTKSFLLQGGGSYVHYFNSSTSLDENTAPLLNQHLNLIGGIGMEVQYDKTEDGNPIPRWGVELNYTHPMESNITPRFANLSNTLVNEAFNTSRIGYVNLSVHIYTR
jgi:hypothetical protein